MVVAGKQPCVADCEHHDDWSGTRSGNAGAMKLITCVSARVARKGETCVSPRREPLGMQEEVIGKLRED